jgi:hypothetical protein
MNALPTAQTSKVNPGARLPALHYATIAATRSLVPGTTIDVCYLRSLYLLLWLAVSNCKQAYAEHLCRARISWRPLNVPWTAPAMPVEIAVPKTDCLSMRVALQPARGASLRPSGDKIPGSPPFKLCRTLPLLVVPLSR